MSKKIAFCFLIYDKINHEDLWHLFFKNIDKNKYSIYIHYKENVQLTYFEEYKLKNCIETKYGDISLVKAQNLMLLEALKDLQNTHFVLLSNSCIPVKNFNHIYNFLDENYSYFNLAQQSACFPRCNEVLKYIEPKYIQKASQWCILNRKHANLMVIGCDHLLWFNNIFAADEHCYITNIYFHGLEKELKITLDCSYGATTCVFWDKIRNRVSQFRISFSYLARNISNINEEELLKILDSESLFARKFMSECSDDLKNERYIKMISS